MRRHATIALAGTAVLLGACQPALDWREVRVPPTRLQALLPCKPDTAVRTVPLAGEPVEMHLVGCKADGAQFVLGWVPVSDPARLGAMLGAWQDATLAHIGIAAGPDSPAGKPFLPAGAAALPQARRIDAVGRPGPTADPLVLRGAWFASTGGPVAYALYVGVVGSGSVPDATAEALFESVRLSP